MSKVVQYSRAASQELIARLVNAGYLQPALRNNADAMLQILSADARNSVAGDVV